MGIQQSADCKRLCTWLAIQDFAEEHGLSYLEILELPIKDGEKLRDAFSSGGILENGTFNSEKDADDPKLQNLRNIQNLLCGKNATFDTVCAALTIEEAYKQNISNYLGCGMSAEDALCKATWQALKDAFRFTCK